MENVVFQLRELVLRTGVEVIVSGGARGVDSTAEREADNLLLPVISFRPFRTGGQYAIERWLIRPGDVPERTVLPERYPTFAAAAFVRNGYIVELSELVLAFWDGESKGTADTIRKAKGSLGPDKVEVFR
jgi:hypothetical protein